MLEQSAIERLPENIDLLSEAVDTLEQILLRAETLKTPDVERVVPFASLFWLYASAMRDLLRSQRADRSMLWNAPALAALCRPLQDSFLSFFYFGIEKVGEEEAEFRVLLLHRHHAFKHAELLSKSDQTIPEIAKARVEAESKFAEVQKTLVGHAFFASLPSDHAKKIRKERDRFIFEPQQAIWSRAGLPIELYESVFRYLSQWVHATPYALRQLRFQHAGKEEGAVYMNIPVGLALSCICLVMNLVTKLDPDLEKLLPKGFREYMEDPETTE